MYVVTGATGNIGGRIAHALLKNGQKVRVIARNKEKLSELAKAGADVAVGSMDDSAFLKTAFSGGTAAFLLIPPEVTAPDVRAYQRRIGQNQANALKGSGITHIANLSSYGAHLASGTGPIAGLYEQENLLNTLEGIHVLHLRPTYFMENTFHLIPVIKSMGVMGSASRPDVSFPAIATQDVAEVGADRLLKRNFSGKQVQELLGPRDITMQEAARVLGKAIGKPDLSYVQFPYEAAEQGMIQGGLSPDMARLYIEMIKAKNDGIALNPKQRDKSSTTPTTLEQFAPAFAAAYNG